MLVPCGGFQRATVTHVSAEGSYTVRLAAGGQRIVSAAEMLAMVPRNATLALTVVVSDTAGASAEAAWAATICIVAYTITQYFPKITKKVPPSLVAIVVATGVEHCIARPCGYKTQLVIDYTVFRADGTTALESSKDTRRMPFAFTVGTGAVHKAIDEAVRDMKPGDVRRVARR